MAASEIGTVTSGSGKQYVVRWDSYSHEVYVNYANGTYVGKASSASEAMNIAEAWLYNK